jgi:hypothetical protein
MIDGGIYFLQVFSALSIIFTMVTEFFAPDFQVVFRLETYNNKNTVPLRHADMLCLLNLDPASTLQFF